MTLVEIARQLDYIREAQDLGQNRGLRVEGICRFGGADLSALAQKDGPSWCCYFATTVLDIAYKGKAPISRGGSCQDVYEQALQSHWIVEEPEADDLFLYVNDAGHAHHIGFVVSASPLVGIAGNTSRDGTSSNGDGVYEHPLLVPLKNIKYLRLP